MAAVAMDAMDRIRVEGQPGAQRGPHVELVDSVTNVQIPTVLHPHDYLVTILPTLAGTQLAFRNPRGSGRLGS